ncbi:HNH endonuclease signature motif containing protein [Planctomonas deserti]|uniref:HNH endonuclease signature motif containing protein n=1 Tax=Planctomonas deserti TaxID=2144185 RepID=UPI000D348709|nr:HNH endonuclease signature motif containing protein [Planctomonas deserti]
METPTFPPEPAPPGTPPGAPETFAAMIDAVKMFEGFSRWAAACRAEAIDRARLWTEATDLSVPTTGGPRWSPRVAGHRVLVTELACALRISERAAENLVAESQALVHDLPATRKALQDGRIGYRHAQVLIDHTNTLPAAGVAAVEEAVLPKAESLTVPKLDRATRDLRERLHPESITERHTKSVTDRHVETCPAQDGMAWLNAFLPAPEITGIANRLRDIAEGLKAEPGEERTRTQLMADAFTDLLLDGTTTAAPTSDTETTAEAVEHRSTPRIDAPIGVGIRPRVLVTVPVLTLLGRSEEPGTLEGYGPIDAYTARRIAAKAPSFTRILTHPETQAVLSVGRDRYAVPKDLRTWLRVRDETCRFPGCNRSAARADIDHVTDWQYGGGTDYGNLVHLCRSHHRVKHHTAWSSRSAGGGRVRWLSPSGHEYETEPATHIRPPKRKRLQTQGSAAPIPDEPPF